MTDVVADIGGTNLRVGLVENAQILRTEVVRGPLPQSEFVPLVRRLAAVVTLYDELRVLLGRADLMVFDLGVAGHLLR